MSTTQSIILAAVVLVVVVLLLVLWARARSRARLRERFGPEYDRTLESVGSRSEAERELQRREARYDALGIHPLEPDQRARYRMQWNQVQARFVDDPRGALSSADSLVTSVMGDRGYPVGGFEQREADLSVEHGAVLDHYRAAHVIDLRDARATTEQMREAMVHYRAMFTELLEDGAAEGEGRTTTGGDNEGARR